MNELLNLVGLCTGACLYSMLLVMIAGRVLRGRAAALADRTTGAFDPLLLATAIFGLTWNLCALAADELPKLGMGHAGISSVIGFVALGFLPAVVVHSVARGGERGGRLVSLVLIACAYGASAIAGVLQVSSALQGHAPPSVAAMRLLTYSFVALIVPLVLRTRRQPGSRRALWAVALATFAVSALHLSHLREGVDSWPVALVGHHASIPLALAILYEDYPFALADLFLKRAIHARAADRGGLYGSCPRGRPERRRDCAVPDRPADGILGVNRAGISGNSPMDWLVRRSDRPRQA